MITLNEMRQILLAFGKIFNGSDNKGKEVDNELVKLYYSVLGHVDVELLKITTKEVIANETFFPKPAQLKDMINKLACKQAGLVSAEEAWSEVQSNLSVYGSVSLGEIIDKTVKSLGGYKFLASVEMNKLTFYRKDFIKTYNNYLTRTKEDFALLPETNDYIKKLTGQISDKFRLVR